MNIFNFPITVSKIKKTNNSYLEPILIDYLNKYKCCLKYPKCLHPKEQSASSVFEISNPIITELKESYFNFIKNIFLKFKIVESKSWVLLVKKGQPLPSIWHKHYDEKYKKYTQLSGIYYVTNTELGTEFKNELFNIEIKPRVNHWYIWDSSIEHRPKEAISSKDRIILATQTVIKI